MHRPARQRQAYPMDAAAQIIRDRGFARIVDEVAISDAPKQTANGYNDPGYQRSPHLFSTSPGKAGREHHYTRVIAAPHRKDFARQRVFRAPAASGKPAPLLTSISPQRKFEEPCPTRAVTAPEEAT